MEKKIKYVRPRCKKYVEPYIQEPRLPEINFQKIFNRIWKKIIKSKKPTKKQANGRKIRKS